MPTPATAQPRPPVVSTVSAMVSAEDSHPRSSSHNRPFSPKQWGPLSLQTCVWEGVLMWRNQVRMVGCQVWLWWKGQMRETLCAQASRQKSEKQSELPSTP
jgi:hypothetical protein